MSGDGHSLMSEEPPGAMRIALHRYVERDIHARLEALRKKVCYHHIKAEPFMSPVTEKFAHDPNLLAAYEQEIVRPMDLRTIQEALDGDLSLPYSQKRYRTIEDFALDMRQTFMNGMMFNPIRHKDDKTENHFFTWAKDLCNIFDRHLARVEADIEDNYARSNAVTAGTAAAEDVEDNHYFRFHPVSAAVPIPLKARCQLLLSDIRRNPFSEHFRREWGWKSLGPVYFEKIRHKTKNPNPRGMDLDRIQTNMDEGFYDRHEPGLASTAAAAAEAHRAAHAAHKAAKADE